MTEQELYKKLENYHTRPDSIRDIVGFAKAYTAAQVAEKEKEIQNATKREILLKQEIDEYARNAEADRLEIARLKAENANLQDWITQHVKTKKALKAENERLKLGIKRLVAEGQLYERWLLVDPDKLISLLSPAPEKPEEKAAPEPLTKQCRFSLAWIGSCKKPCGESGFCDQHEGVKCCKCGKQATQECPHTSQFVCGFPICDTCKHH